MRVSLACSVILFTAVGLFVPSPVAAEIIGPLPYLSASDIPANFYLGGSPAGLEDFEDRSLDFGITASRGNVVGPGGNTDSVDADDGLIDGLGTNGRSWFAGDEGTMASVTFTFAAPLPTAAGIVWTDGAQIHEIFFEAFGPGMVSLGSVGPFTFADSTNIGTTSEDRFFGVRDPGGVLAIQLSNVEPLSIAGGIEVDHVQFGTAVPEPSSICLLVPLVGWLVVRLNRHERKQSS